MWFLWLLLAADFAAAGLYQYAPRWGSALIRFSSSARNRPVRYFAGLVIVSAVAYVSLAKAFINSIAADSLTAKTARCSASLGRNSLLCVHQGVPLPRRDRASIRSGSGSQRRADPRRVFGKQVRRPTGHRSALAPWS